MVLAFTLPALSQAKHPLTFDDMMKLKRVGEPEVSPDGKWVIFSVVNVDLDANTKTPHIWIVPLSAKEKAGSSTPQNASPSANHSAPVGMTEEKSGVEKNGVPHVSPNLRDMGGTERELIPDQDGDRPRWAPDGKRFAFLSTKEGGSQVWIADFDSAAGTVTGVHKLTSLATETGGELWSPDGKLILFTSDVYPECDGEFDEMACNAKKQKEHEDSKVKAQIVSRLLYRHWNAYKEGKRSHIFIAAVDACLGTAASAVRPGESGQAPGCPAGAARDLTPGDYDAPVFSLGGQDNYAFSPDGQEICYTSNHDKNEAASTNNDLWIVPVSVGTDHVGAGDSPAQVLARTKNITADNPAGDTTPLYSPDGKYIAYRAQQRPGYESDRFRLMLYDRKTGEKSDMTLDFDHWVGNFAWAPDSKTIYLSAEHERHSLIYAVGAELQGAARNEYPRRALVAGYNDDIAITPNGKTLLFTRMSMAAPNEIYAANAAGDGCPARTGQVDRGKESCSLNQDWAVTHVNETLLAQISMSSVESFWFRGAHGDDVESSLVKPPNFDASKKYPVKFLIHGGPQGAWGDDWSFRWNAELFAAPTSSTSSGYVVIMINFHGSTGYGQKFIDAINGDWGGAPYEDLMKGLDYAEKTYPFIDKSRECALGASYGGYAINWILGHTDRFKCLVSHDGMFNAESAWGTTEELWFNDWEFKGTPYDNRASYEKWSPHQYARNFKTPTLVIHGQRDYRLDVSEGFQLFTTLQMEGIPSKMLYFPDEGHWVLKPQNSRLWYQTVNDWVDQWTK
jgi:dipeptidyl aminopeptidase/acylaminoacyl peptidase